MMVAAVDLLKGIAAGAGMGISLVEGANGGTFFILTNPPPGTNALLSYAPRQYNCRFHGPPLHYNPIPPTRATYCRTAYKAHSRPYGSSHGSVSDAPGKRDGKDTKVTDMLYACYDRAAAGEDFKEPVISEPPLEKVFTLPSS